LLMFSLLFSWECRIRSCFWGYEFTSVVFAAFLDPPHSGRADFKVLLQL
jgi:hypothetical protein